jgi:hypothetical protein
VKPTILFLLAGTVFAQSYDFRPVLGPGAIIAGHSFDRNTRIDTAVINDSGEVAFTAHWPIRGEYYPTASVFTLRRLVADGHGVLDGKRLMSISHDARIAISPSGLVAFEAFYDPPDAPGIFVENHYAFTPGEIPDLKFFGFSVTDDRLVHMEGPCDKCKPLPMLSRNRRGQIVIPLNTNDGPYIIVATPR